MLVNPLGRRSLLDFSSPPHRTPSTRESARLFPTPANSSTPLLKTKDAPPDLPCRCRSPPISRPRGGPRQAAPGTVRSGPREWWPSDRIDAGTPANAPGDGRGEGDLVVDKGSPGRAEPHSPALQRRRPLGEWWPGDRIVRGSACSSPLTLQPRPARTCRKPRSPLGVRVRLHRRPQADRGGAGEGGQVRCVRRFDPDALHLVLYLYGCTYLPVELCC